jgi:hypothetical protein
MAAERKRRPAYVAKEWKGTVGGAIDEAFSEFEALAGEMREAADNMEGANMEHLPKYETTSAAADEMEGHTDAVDYEGDVGDLEITTTIMVPSDRRRQPSRAMRLSNAQGLLQAARDRCDEVEEPDDIDDEDAATQEQKEAHQKAVDLKERAEQLSQDLDEHCEFDVEFPGMYG